jgi:hypothetical protein
MPKPPVPLDLKKLLVHPLARRQSMARVEDILVDPAAAPPALANDFLRERVGHCARQIKAARARGASVMFLYGAHLVKNGAQAIMEKLLAGGWVTHLATNGAGSIHDWEFAFQNWSTESVEQNVVNGTFGAWDETGRCLHLALLAGGLRGEGYGAALGRFIQEDGVTLPARISFAPSPRIRFPPLAPTCSWRCVNTICPPDAST